MSTPEVPSTHLPPSGGGAGPLPERLVGDGRYRLTDMLGKGAFGTVYAATNDKGFPFAVKIIQQPTSPGRSSIANYELEALEELKAVAHTHLLRTFDYFREGDQLIIVMERARNTLHDLIKDGRGIDLDVLLGYMAEAAEALDFLHAKKIIHRDVKPANILLMDDGHVRVADFSLARALPDFVNSIKASQAVGTPAYMAPETYSHDNAVVHRAGDLFGLAASYLELRLGRWPKDAHNKFNWIAFSGNRPNVDGLFEAEKKVVLKALAVDPAERHRSCKEFVDELRRAVQKKGSSGLFGWIPGFFSGSGPVSVERPPERATPPPSQATPASAGEPPLASTPLQPAAKPLTGGPTFGTMKLPSSTPPAADIKVPPPVPPKKSSRFDEPIPTASRTPALETPEPWPSLPPLDLRNEPPPSAEPPRDSDPPEPPPPSLLKKVAVVVFVILLGAGAGAAFAYRGRIQTLVASLFPPGSPETPRDTSPERPPDTRKGEDPPPDQGKEATARLDRARTQAQTAKTAEEWAAVVKTLDEGALPADAAAVVAALRVLAAPAEGEAAFDALRTVAPFADTGPEAFAWEKTQIKERLTALVAKLAATLPTLDLDAADKLAQKLLQHDPQLEAARQESATIKTIREGDLAALKDLLAKDPPPHRLDLFDAVAARAEETQDHAAARAAFPEKLPDDALGHLAYIRALEQAAQKKPAPMVAASLVAASKIPAFAARTKLAGRTADRLVALALEQAKGRTFYGPYGTVEKGKEVQTWLRAARALRGDAADVPLDVNLALAGDGDRKDAVALADRLLKNDAALATVAPLDRAALLYIRANVQRGDVRRYFAAIVDVLAALKEFPAADGEAARKNLDTLGGQASRFLIDPVRNAGDAFLKRPNGTAPEDVARLLLTVADRAAAFLDAHLESFGKKATLDLTLGQVDLCRLAVKTAGKEPIAKESRRRFLEAALRALQIKEFKDRRIELTAEATKELAQALKDADDAEKEKLKDLKDAFDALAKEQPKR